jgi:hypothetical protein
MIDSTENRATRRRNAARRAGTGTLAGAAAAAMAFGLAGAPAANARPVDITWDPTYTAGALAGVINALGNAFPGTSVGGLYNSGPPQSVNLNIDTVIDAAQAGQIPVEISLSLLLKYINNNSSTVNNGAAKLYNTIANIPAPTCTNNANASNCRYALMLGTSEATLNLVEAYRAQIQAVTTGTPPAGYLPFEASPTSTQAKPTVTAQGLAFLQNPVRPNGGLLSRFPDIAKALRVDSTMPAAGKYTSADGKVLLNTTTIDATWAYDPTADFPEVFNLTALANSFWAALPLNLVTGGLGGVVLTDSAGNTATATDLGLNLAGLLKMPIPILGTLPDSLWGGVGKAYYATIVPNTLPILTPLELPGFLINTALKSFNSPYLLGNPAADALAPALKILVNIAYPDVVTPTEGGTYNRTFLTAGTEIPFGSVQPLTPEEKKAVPGDVWNAFVGGVQDQLAKPFWGIVVPNSTGAAAPAAAKAAATATPAAAAAASPVAAPAPAEPVAVPQVAVSAPEPAAAPVADPDPVVSVPVDEPAPVATRRAAAAAEAGQATTRTPHRGRASSSDNSDAPKASASSGRHRSAG